MNLIIKKYKYFNECINNPTFASKVYLELLNRNTELDMTFDEFDEIMNETYEKFLNENIDYLEIALNEEKGKNPIEQVSRAVGHGVQQMKQMGSDIKGATSNINQASEKTKEVLDNANDVINANKGKVSSTLTNTEEVTKKVNKMVDDNKDKVSSTLSNVNDVTGDLAKRYKNTTAKIDKTKAHFKKHGKKYIAGGAAVAATAITVKAVKKAKDKKKYQAWKAKNPKERQYIGMKQWIDLGRPLDEATNIFIDGYFDAILENLE